MKTALPGIAVLPPGIVAELYTLTLADNTELYYTSLDIDLSYRGQLYKAGLLLFERDALRLALGVDVDEVMITVYPGNNYLLQGLPLANFVLNGGFDGAWLKIERAYHDYTAHLFEGMITDAQPDSKSIQLMVSAASVLLNQPMPRNVYTPGCSHTLFNSGCGLTKTDFAHPSSVTTGTTKSVIHCGLTQAGGYFALGTLKFTGGVNAGLVCTIKGYSPGVIALSYPLPNLPDLGDTFNAYPGCNKTLTTCQTKFTNQQRYRGFPFIPRPEEAI